MSYAEWYTLIIKYEGQHGQLFHVFAKRYSYIALLSDIYKLLDIGVDFVSIKASNRLIIENDLDLLLIMELYKNSHVIILNVSLVLLLVFTHL